MTTTATTTRAAGTSLSPRRLMLMRAVYGFIGVGLVVGRWPLLPDARELSRYEGTTLALLAGMSVLMLLGLRHPTLMLPMLVFESLWKLVWLGLVGLPLLLSGGLDDGKTETLVNCLLVVPVLVAVPWGHVWRTYVVAPGEAWR